MLLTFDGVVRFIVTRHATPRLRLRSTAPILKDGQPIEPDSDGEYSFDLSHDQRTVADEMLKSGKWDGKSAVTLPDGGHRGAPKVAGVGAADYLASIGGQTPAQTPRKARARKSA